MQAMCPTVVLSMTNIVNIDYMSDLHEVEARAGIDPLQGDVATWAISSLYSHLHFGFEDLSCTQEYWIKGLI